MQRPGLRKPLSYNDALALLGANDSGAVALARRVAGIAVAAVDVGTVGALGFFELRDEAVGWGNSMVTNLRERMTGISRLDRTERIVAAHAVIVITSFYEALQSEDVVDLQKAKLTAAEQVAIGTDTPVRDSYRTLVASLAGSEYPIPSPSLPFEQALNIIARQYGGLISALRQFLSGLAAFENAPVFKRDDVYARTIDTALRHYEISYRRLSADVPEFGMWASMTDAQATRASVDMLGSDLRSRLDAMNLSR